jgi:hypothetical protein
MVRGRPGGFLSTADAVVQNFLTQFKMVCHVGTLPFLPMPKCHLNTRCVSVAESLFLKNVSMAKAQCCLDQRSMLTKGYEPLHTSPCITLRHLVKHGSGAKFKSSTCFCRTLYISKWMLRSKLVTTEYCEIS